ncbi:DUF5916 domain-containing protein [Paraglaciecola sp.]|uniref:carbohydrate binding family 9 domain-containing protein n=1 Tax=Paraglaciecola sp. TaxID=1920173 RepID=UPI003EF11BF5
MLRISLSILLTVLLCSTALGQSSMTVPNLQMGVVLDGELNEVQWQTAKQFELKYVTSPFENTAPPVTTIVRMFEDGQTLYVSFEALDPDVSQIRTSYRDRDKIWSHDLVGVKLDPFNDSRIAYEFFVNPFGVQADAIENEMTGNESDNWDAVWRSAGKILEGGYQVEIAIPLQIMNFEESENIKTWGAEFVRFYPRQDKLRISNMPKDRNNSCTLCQLGEISGFKKSKQGKNLTFVPTLVVGKGRERDIYGSNIWDDSNNQEVGLDVKWGITPEVSLQATLNPDFSQVESDVAQLSINNTFALYFDEKRPFFLENSDYFTSNFNLVHTRNVNAPDYGVKVTGRVDQHTFGLFVANDENTSFIVPGNLGSNVAILDRESINVAARYRHDLSSQLSIGWTSTLRDADFYHNYVNGLDAKYQVTSKDILVAQFLSSDTQYPIELYKEFCDNDCSQSSDSNETSLRLQKEDSFSDNAYRLAYYHEERDWFTELRYESVGEGFRRDLGFGSRVDRNRVVVGAGYNWYSENTWWHRVRLSGDWDISHNDANEVLEKEAEVYVSVHGKFQSYFEIGQVQRERVGLRHDPSLLSIQNNTTLFTENQSSMFFEARPVSALYFNMSLSYGDQIDFDNNRLGKQLQIRPRISLDVGDHLQLSVRHTYKKLDIQQDNLFKANLTDMRITYQFDQKQFLRLIFVRSDITRNQDLYLHDEVDEEYKSLGTQLLYSYKLNPLTKFFVGYSDSAEQNELIQRLTKNEQSVFMKFSYAWMN